jgi:UDP-glucuronate 4-epimerase
MRAALVTGGAGFIGSHVVDRLLAEGWRVTVLDNFDPWYDPAIKRENLAAHSTHPDFRLIEVDIRDRGALNRAVARGDDYEVIIHLAAKAGVRPSIEDPFVYQDVNVSGTQNVLELARLQGVKQFVFSSSSSVYGMNANVPWREDDFVLQPISPYASSKVSGELMGHVYSHLHGIRFIALRCFTVYGPRQRPDLAIHKFARQIIAGEPISIYGDGRTRRDYTFVGDIVEGIRGAIEFTDNPYEVINLGNGRPIALIDLVRAIEQAVGKHARIRWEAEQPGDVPQTYASILKAEMLLGYRPQTALVDGIASFLNWLRCGEGGRGQVYHGVTPPLPEQPAGNS